MFSRLSIPIKKELFGSLFYDYLTQIEKVKPFYAFYPDRDGYKSAIHAIGANNFNRELLVKEIKNTAGSVKNTSPASLNNTELLLNNSTFTVTTGHQLCLFTGPLYFVYKIFSVINLCEKLKAEFPQNDFVPVYWMASEDHDFAEVNHFNIYGKKVEWTSVQTGAVGDFETKELAEVLSVFKEIAGSSTNAEQLVELFENAYLKHNSLTEATRYLVNELFGIYGIVIVDGNNKLLKQSFAKYFEDDIFENDPFKEVNRTIDQLSGSKYEAQVNPREINCFYMEKGIRARIEKENDIYKVTGTNKTFTKEELKQLIQNQTEKISPNVVLRPMYQQFILPNLAYVGGPGELAYWLEYKAMFEKAGLFFPVLTPRKFVTIMDTNTVSKLGKLGFEKENVFEGEQEMIKLYLEKNNKSFDLEQYKRSLESLFKNIAEEMNKVDKTLLASADAEKQKNLKSIEVLEQKTIRAIKQKSETEINQIKTIKSKLFPDGVPQERYENFSMHYAKWGNGFMDALKQNLTYDLKRNEMEIVFEV